jgi:hypothetical protein
MHDKKKEFNKDIESLKNNLIETLEMEIFLSQMKKKSVESLSSKAK